MTDPTQARVLQASTKLLPQVLELAVGLRHQGRLRESSAWLRLAAQLTDEASSLKSLRIELLTELGMVLAMQDFHANGRYDEAIHTLAEAVALAMVTQDLRLIGRARQNLGIAQYYSMLFSSAPDFTTAKACLADAYTTFERLASIAGMAVSKFYLGLIAERTEGEQQAYDLYGQADELAAAADDAIIRSYTSRHLAALHDARGEIDEALHLYERSLTLRREAGYRIHLPLAAAALADFHLRQGNSSAAAEFAAEALAVAEQHGLPLALISALSVKAAACQAAGESEAAEGYLARARAVAEQTNRAWMVG